MPIIENTAGYDPIVSYSIDELAEMYITEGMDEPQAYIQAKRIRREIKRLNIYEQRLWKKVREREYPQGKLIENF